MAEAAIASAGGDSSAGATWADAALDYVAFLHEHIAKENGILFVTGERMLSPDEQTRLFTEFEGVDKNKMDEGESERLLQIERLPRSPHESCPVSTKARPRGYGHACRRNDRHNRIRTRPFHIYASVPVGA